MNRSLSVARNLMTTLGVQLVSWTLTFVVTLYLPRYIGDRGLGAITLAGSFAALFSLIVALGTSTVMIKEIARNRAQAGPLLVAALLIRLPLGLLAIGLGWGVSILLGYSPGLRLLITVALATMALVQISDALGSALRGLENFSRQNLASLVDKILLAALTILLITRHAPLWTLVGAGSVSTLVSLLISSGAFRRHVQGIGLPRKETVALLTISGLPFLTTSVFVAIYGQADALLLSRLSTLAAIGWYGLAKRLGGTALMLPAALTSVMLPSLSRMWHEDRAAFRNAIHRLFNLMFICVVPFAAVLMLAPGQVLKALHYPPTFRHAIPVMALMGASIILWYLSQVAGTALIACDRQAALSRITLVAAVISVPTCAALIFLTQRSLGNGAIGAMLADAVVEGYLIVSYLRALPPDLFSWRQFSVLGRSIAAAVPLISIFYFVHDARSLLLIVPGILCYAALCTLLGCLQRQDWQMVQALLRRRVNA